MGGPSSQTAAPIATSGADHANGATSASDVAPEPQRPRDGGLAAETETAAETATATDPGKETETESIDAEGHATAEILVAAGTTKTPKTKRKTTRNWSSGIL